MIDLREAARGKPCTLMLPQICNGRWETTVLAHIRRLPFCGVGLKPPDILGVRACSSCHDAMDMRARRPDGDFESTLLTALMRTLTAYDDEGLL